MSGLLRVSQEITKVQGLLTIYAVCNLCANKNLGALKAHQGGPYLFALVSSIPLTDMTIPNH